MPEQPRISTSQGGATNLGENNSDLHEKNQKAAVDGPAPPLTSTLDHLLAKLDYSIHNMHSLHKTMMAEASRVLDTPDGEIIDVRMEGQGTTGTATGTTGGASSNEDGADANKFEDVTDDLNLVQVSIGKDCNGKGVLTLGKPKSHPVGGGGRSSRASSSASTSAEERSAESSEVDESSIPFLSTGEEHDQLAAILPWASASHQVGDEASDAVAVENKGINSNCDDSSSDPEQYEELQYVDEKERYADRHHDQNQISIAKKDRLLFDACARNILLECRKRQLVVRPSHILAGCFSGEMTTQENNLNCSRASSSYSPSSSTTVSCSTAAIATSSAGCGVFTEREIKKGEVVFSYRGRILCRKLPEMKNADGGPKATIFDTIRQARESCMTKNITTRENHLLQQLVFNESDLGPRTDRAFRYRMQLDRYHDMDGGTGGPAPFAACLAAYCNSSRGVSVCHADTEEKQNQIENLIPVLDHTKGLSSKAVQFVARRDIAVGEELLWDYDFHMENKNAEKTGDTTSEVVQNQENEPKNKMNNHDPVYERMLFHMNRGESDNAHAF
ncbi:unnamed protein product [Amoebophrya sp. A120]|nr:unnamed protein product [Amoebophrya sp. A120]|eukprot:GSA120T00019675001.1